MDSINNGFNESLYGGGDFWKNFSKRVAPCEEIGDDQGHGSHYKRERGGQGGNDGRKYGESSRREAKRDNKRSDDSNQTRNDSPPLEKRRI